MEETEIWTLDRIVAWNLRDARQDHDWSQEELGRRLAPYLGEEWSKALVSQAERSLNGTRIRPFRADELLAFSRCLSRPIVMFLLPPYPNCFVGVTQAVEGVTLEEPIPAEEWVKKLVAPAMPVALLTEWRIRGGAAFPSDFWTSSSSPAAPLLRMLSEAMERSRQSSSQLDQALEAISQQEGMELLRQTPGEKYDRLQRQKGKRKPKEEGDAG